MSHATDPRTVLSDIERRWSTHEAWPSWTLLGDIDWLLRVAKCAAALDDAMNEFWPEYPEAIAEHAQALQGALYAMPKDRPRG